MADCAELLARAQAAPASLSFKELCQLAECYGWEFARTKGSHCLYKRPGSLRMMNFQDDNGAAKPYQVRQLVNAISELESTDS